MWTGYQGTMRSNRANWKLFIWAKVLRRKQWWVWWGVHPIWSGFISTVVWIWRTRISLKCITSISSVSTSMKLRAYHLKLFILCWGAALTSRAQGIWATGDLRVMKCVPLSVWLGTITLNWISTAVLIGSARHVFPPSVNTELPKTFRPLTFMLRKLP